MSALYTADQVAERYGVNAATVRRWARAGLIKGLLIGRHTLFTQESLDEYERRSAIPVPMGRETELQAFHRARRNASKKDE